MQLAEMTKLRDWTAKSIEINVEEFFDFTRYVGHHRQHHHFHHAAADTTDPPAGTTPACSTQHFCCKTRCK